LCLIFHWFLFSSFLVSFFVALFVCVSSYACVCVFGHSFPGYEMHLKYDVTVENDTRI